MSKNLEMLNVLSNLKKKDKIVSDYIQSLCLEERQMC